MGKREIDGIGGRRGGQERKETHHSSNSKVRTDTVLLSIGFDVFEGMDAWREQLILI
jgi:hypothetical protein